MTTYTNKEMQVVMIARQIKNGQTIVVGTGLPLAGGALAKLCYAPQCTLVVESGMIGCGPPEAPAGVGDMRLQNGASSVLEEYRYFGLQNNNSRNPVFDLGFIGGAQIDPYGNVNSMSIGDYYHPKTRFTGSGGANGIATFMNTILMMQHQKRRFVEQVDYLTSPGWIDGPEGRAKKGLPADKGPLGVITDLGLMKFDADTKRMYLAEYYPGVTEKQVLDNTGFEMDISRAVQSLPPEPEVLETLRTKIDPTGLYHLGN